MVTLRRRVHTRKMSLEMAPERGTRADIAVWVGCCSQPARTMPKKYGFVLFCCCFLHWSVFRFVRSSGGNVSRKLHSYRRWFPDEVFPNLVPNFRCKSTCAHTHTHTRKRLCAHILSNKHLNTHTHTQK